MQHNKISNNTKQKLPQLHEINYDHSRKFKALDRKLDLICSVQSKISGNSIIKEDLEEDAKKIKIIYYQSENVQKSLVEIRTNNWCNLGRMLLDHCSNVLSAGFNWDVWVADHFHYISDRRIEQCMELARFGEKIEPYFYMGIDRIYDLFHKLLNYKNDPEFKKIGRRFKFTFKTTPTTKNDRTEHNKKADMIREYFKFKNNVNNNKISRDLLCDVIECGGKFSKQDYIFFNDISKNKEDLDEYLLKTMSNGSSPVQKKKIRGSREGINVILSKLIQTIKKYEEANKYPEYLDINIFEKAYRKLTLLNEQVLKQYN